MHCALIVRTLPRMSRDNDISKWRWLRRQLLLLSHECGFCLKPLGVLYRTEINEEMSIQGSRTSYTLDLDDIMSFPDSDNVSLDYNLTTGDLGQF